MSVGVSSSQPCSTAHTKQHTTCQEQFVSRDTDWATDSKQVCHCAAQTSSVTCRVPSLTNASIPFNRERNNLSADGVLAETLTLTARLFRRLDQQCHLRSVEFECCYNVSCHRLNGAVRAALQASTPLARLHPTRSILTVGARLCLCCTCKVARRYHCASGCVDLNCSRGK